VTTFLIGFMAAGKTTVGTALAARTGRSFIDLDDEITRSGGGESAAELVKRSEPEFRAREAATLQALIDRKEDLVIATGGGAAAYGDNVDRMRARGLVIALDVELDEARERATHDASARPLLDDRAGERYRDRAPFYRRAHAVIRTSGKAPPAIADEVCHVEAVYQRAPSHVAALLALGDRTYPVVVAETVFDPQLFSAALGSPSKIAILTDTNVAAHWLAAAGAAFPAAGVVTVPAGEGSKSFAMYERVCAEMIALGLDRSSAIVALGGGVVGDLAGFVAATLFRGIPVVQVPTTLVAMTDAAIGGKTAIDTAAGKNLVGAFWQPRLVACGLETLATLPARERRAGYGELWKYALLGGPGMWSLVSDPAALGDVITRAIAYKAAVVSADERELTGRRALLNLGHTVGHAIESASAETSAPLLHGEAVGLGLLAACRVSAAVVGTSVALEGEVREALRSSGLPSDLDPWLTDEVLARMSIDKKRVGSELKFIVVREVGQCEPIAIPVTDVRRILRPVTSA